MTSREKILARIREGLREPGPRPGAHDHGAASRVGASHQPPSRWLPHVGQTQEEWVQAFEAASIGLKTEFHWLAGEAFLAPCLADLRDREGWARIASHRGPLADRAVAAVGLPALLTDGGYDVHELEKCDAGISECDFLIAQTGSVMLTARSGGGRGLSVLPPHHVVIARRDQLLPDLPSGYAAMKKKYDGAWPSLITLITGPSRTGDIERILVLGAHGPKKLTVVVY